MDSYDTLLGSYAVARGLINEVANCNLNRRTERSYEAFKENKKWNVFARVYMTIAHMEYNAHMRMRRFCAIVYGLT